MHLSLRLTGGKNSRKIVSWNPYKMYKNTKGKHLKFLAAKDKYMPYVCPFLSTQKPTDVDYIGKT